MKSQASIIIAFFAFILVSCAPISTPEPIQTSSTNTPQPTATFTLEPTATFTPEPTATFTPEPTATFTPEPTATPELFDIQVLAFWDYNGNGTFDEGEVSLEGIMINTGSAECMTGENGMCFLGQYTEGQRLGLRISDNIDRGNGLHMGYFFPDNTKFIPITDEINLRVNDDTFLVPLGIGFMSSAMDCNTTPRVTVGWGVNGHQGTDWDIPVGTPIYAAIPGKVNFAGKLPNGNLTITLETAISGKYQVGTAHLSEILVNPGDTVKRGDLIGYSGKSGPNTGPHLHLSLYDLSSGNPADINPNGFWITGNTQNYATSCQPPKP